MTKTPIQVRELNHVAIYVRDLEASMHFYGQVVGLPLLTRPAFPFPGAWFALGSQELHLLVDTLHVNDERHSVHLALRVDDAHAAYESLLAASVLIPSPPAARPDGATQVFFRDPDGYLIEMVSFP